MGWLDSHRTPLDRKGELTDAIRKALDPVQTPGPFLSVQNAEIFPLPGLEVDGVGPIGLPISPHDARALISAGRLRADVKPTRNIRKAHAPKSWELNEDQFVFANHRWQIGLRAWLSKALSNLELSVSASEVEIRPHKLVIDEEGAVSSPQLVSEKDNGMFGTLSVYLPSKHEGGDVIATCKGERATFITAPRSAYNITNIVSFTDVIHEAQEITSGYRVVMCYSLHHALSAALLSAEYPWQQLVPMFDEWNKRATTALAGGSNGPAMRFEIVQSPYYTSYVSNIGRVGWV